MKESLDTLLKTLKDDDFISTRKKFGDMWQFVRQKTAYTYRAFKKISVFEKPLTNLKKKFVFKFNK